MDVNEKAERVLAVERISPGLTDRYIEINGTFVTIKNYLINFFPNNMEFDANVLVPDLESMANEADETFRKFKEELFKTTLSDAKYREPVQKTPTEYTTFIEYVDSISPTTLTKEGVRFGNEIESFEYLYARFVDDRYKPEELAEINANAIVGEEPSKEEQDKANKQHKARKVLEAVLNKNGMDIKTVLSNNQFASNFFGKFLDNIDDFDYAFSSGFLTSKITDLVSEYIIPKNDTTSVDRLEEMEIVDSGKTISTKTLMQLDANEKAALVEEFTQKPTRASSGPETTMDGGDDDEEVETIEEPEIEVTLRAK